jgi:hypothetical protein
MQQGTVEKPLRLSLRLCFPLRAFALKLLILTLLHPTSAHHHTAVHVVRLPVK